MPRVHINDLTTEQFVERFERPRLPTVITGACDHWPAASTWTLEHLLARFGDHKFKVALLVYCTVQLPSLSYHAGRERR